ncbi:MAG: DUF3883 domain-containing protein [Acidobacteriota bacterium]|nr:DUF3883 domain-containing protein [Acidobacteriota bacterium]
MTKSKGPIVTADYAARIKRLRAHLQLTTTRLAELLGVHRNSVDRWESGLGPPSATTWERIVAGERSGVAGLRGGVPAASAVVQVARDGAQQKSHEVKPDLAADPDRVVAVVEAHRLAYGHLQNPAFATETSLIVALPHQRIAVYDRMIHQPRLRFLLADDAGAGKTIMSGLYMREMIARKLVRRILIVVPAGLVGNWERELRTFFRLEFQIVGGDEIRAGNPFAGPKSDKIIVSLDTLRGDVGFSRLRENIVEPYELVVFDEAHKLSVSGDPGGRVAKTERYQLAEVLAGAPASKPEWDLRWSAQHLLLLTATPHMGKDYPYYCLWRLLEPNALSTYEAFRRYPTDVRAQHFIRRTKEEMVDFEGRRIYPDRQPNTLVYQLAEGTPSERRLYDEVSAYIDEHYNRANRLNRSAAILAMSVFQRRLASSPYALLRSLQRRLEKIRDQIQDLQSGRVSEQDFARRQRGLTAKDILDEETADEEGAVDGEEAHDVAERDILAANTAETLSDLEAEHQELDRLIQLAKAVDELGQDAKFTRLSEWLESLASNDKLIIFTEHRDTLEMLKRRFEGRGLTGKIVTVHGGMDYRERDAEVERFRKVESEGGARYFIATDAAGEGINLQFCWQMVNYDIPWNPARLEQRMGRIHRFGQKHDPVLITNLVAGNTREGRVLKTLLDKLDRIREELGSDKVFDVIGRLLEGRSMRDLMQEATTEAGARAAETRIDDGVTTDRFRVIEATDQAAFGAPSDVASQLPRLQQDRRREVFRRLLPGYVRGLVARATPLLGLDIRGELDDSFHFVELQAGAMDTLWPALDRYPQPQRERLSVRRPGTPGEAIYLHPGEPVFDAFCDLVRSRFAKDAMRGARFIDATAAAPYFFLLGRISVVRRPDGAIALLSREELLESRLVGLKMDVSQDATQAPLEELLLLRPTSEIRFQAAMITAPDAIARGRAFINDDIGAKLVFKHRADITALSSQALEFASRGFDLEMAELAQRRGEQQRRSGEGDEEALLELSSLNAQLAALRNRRDQFVLAQRRTSELVEIGQTEILALAFVMPSDDPAEVKQRDAAIEAIAIQVARSSEEALGAIVQDVSTPERATAAGLSERPGFDLLSHRPDGTDLSIEVKGRARVGDVDISDNEWSKACNLRDRYWLYVVFNCATAEPQLYRYRDPFSRLLAATRGVVVSADSVIAGAEK